jgi:hypothetical protein
VSAPQGTPILQATGANRAQINGTVVVPLQGGRARLPDVFVADKNDTAKFEGATAGKFALMALAVRRGEGGQLVAIDHVTPAVSNPFVVSLLKSSPTATPVQENMLSQVLCMHLARPGKRPAERR